jgi:hypothetical protein
VVELAFEQETHITWDRDCGQTNNIGKRDTTWRAFRFRLRFRDMGALPQ